jgi:hypothetical protein
MTSPGRERLREVGLNVASTVAWHAQQIGLANKPLGDSLPAVRTAIEEMMHGARIYLNMVGLYA